MWLLHIVAIPATSGWQTGLGLWLLCFLVGGSFAALSGEWHNGDAALTDLLIAGVGALVASVLTAPFGTDPLAQLYGVRLACATAGAVFLLIASHDAVYSLSARESAYSRLLPIGGAGSFQYLFTWLSGWPSEPGLIDASYDGGLLLRLRDEAFHYQVRRGPLVGSETVPVAPGTTFVAAGDGTIRIVSGEATHGGHQDGEIELTRVAPPGASEALADRFNALVAELEGHSE